MAIKIQHIAIAIALMLLLQGFALHLYGRNFICPCGQVLLWDGAINAAVNSQQLLDWYSFIHVIYGIIGFYISWFLHKRFRWPLLMCLLVVIACSAVWEIYENSPYFIHSYAVDTRTAIYSGDSIANSLMDSVCVAAGFVVAWLFPAWLVIPVAAVFEALVYAKIHDGAIVSTILFFEPFAAFLTGSPTWQ